MMQVCIPDDSPSILAGSEAWTLLQSFAEVAYFDTLPGSESTLIERIGTAPAVLNIRSSSRFTERVFASCPTLRLLSIWGTGTDHVDLAAAERYGVKVANTPGVSAISIAEHALALLLAVARQIPAMDSSTRGGEWRRGHFVQLYGKTCGIIGYGAIGREFARIAAGIGMRVTVWTMNPDRYPGVEFIPIDELCANSDVISVHLRLSPETTGFLGPAAFSLMKRNAILINTARGAIVDEPALIEALTRGRIAGAGLDVFATEPLPVDHPITDLSNVVISPHCAGITPEAVAAGLRMAVENLMAPAPSRSRL
jgi:D-3-phosphoglycerate dehydrogenase / 2-oxoglutarate reductase